MGFAVPDAVLMPPAAMVPMAVLAVLAAGQGHVSAVTEADAVGLSSDTLLRNRFSLFAYLIGIIIFVQIGQGVTGGRK
jgi:hypothetical protein